MKGWEFYTNCEFTRTQTVYRGEQDRSGELETSFPSSPLLPTPHSCKFVLICVKPSVVSHLLEPIFLTYIIWRVATSASVPASGRARQGWLKGLRIADCPSPRA